jgi:6-phosphogluconolactonase
MEPQSKATLYVGTYTKREAHVDGHGEGIYVYELDLLSGSLTYVTKMVDTINPSFLVVDPSGRYLYAVNEHYEDLGPYGTVTAFAIDPATRGLTRLNLQSSHGLAPCYVSVDATGGYVLVANYLTGNVCVLPVQEDGSLAPATQVVQHRGNGPHPHQDGPHAHCIIVGPGNRYVVATDKGADKIMVYRLDRRHGMLLAAPHPWLRLSPGTGPRHIAFHPGGRFAYCINELDSTIAALGYDAETGTLEELQRVPTLPQDAKGPNLGADIRMAPSGRFVYGSNRGHDSIVIYAVDDVTGKLTYVGHEPSRGACPRGCAIDPTGMFLLVANQDTSSISTFRIDQATGRLAATGHTAQVPTPVCLQVLPSDGQTRPSGEA